MLPSGVPQMDNYNDLVRSESFRRLERFSNEFLVKHSDSLDSYARKWVKDPLHQWSRQWEYPFVVEHVRHVLSGSSDSAAQILDAGSGVTFFPYYLKSQFFCDVHCVDCDDSLEPVFRGINARADADVGFASADLSSLPFDDNRFDVVYCVSVLEHTEEYPRIIKEFSRVLKDSGILIVTFDVSLDGDRDIPVDDAKRLLEEMNRTFPENDSPPAMLVKSVQSNGLLTTRRIAQQNRRLLPWKNPVLSMLSTLRNAQFPKRWGYPDLTCFCGTFRKPIG